MANAHETSPAKKPNPERLRTFRVLADCQCCVYQDIEAQSAEEAYHRAKLDRDFWEFYSDAGDNTYQLSSEVRDLETEAMISVRLDNSTEKRSQNAPDETPWTAELSSDGSFYQVVNSKGVVLAERCVKEAAELFALAPELLRVARSAATAFEERISCLKDDLRERFGDPEDINDKIGNYQYLLDEHRKILAKAKGGAA